MSIFPIRFQEMIIFYNPILPGWYSDPSICTNGEGDYFLAVSTFTYYPVCLFSTARTW